MTKHSIALSFFAVTLFTALPALSQQHAAKSGINAPSGFDIPKAMQSLFGNYDKKTDTARYDIPQSTIYSLKGSQFEIGDDILVYPLWVSAAKEDSKDKVAFVFYSVPAKPDGSPADFECHACTPLIGAAIFVKEGEQWRVESSRTVTTRRGGFGHPPSEVRIIRIGPHRIGIEITDIYTGQGETTVSKIILVPWNGKINEALVVRHSDENRGGCGKDADNFPCYSNRTATLFVPSKNPEYFDIVLKRSGTDVTDHEPYRAKPIHGYERLSFVNGLYKTTQQIGVKSSVDHDQ